MLRFRPDVKPPMWGPPDAIAFAVRSNAERDGLDPSKILGYWPVFEAGGNKIFSLFGGDKETFAITSGDFEPSVVKNAVLACATSKAKEAHTQLSGVLLMSKMTLSEQYLLTTRSTYNNLYGFTFYIVNGVYLSVRYSSGGSYVTVSSYDMRGKSFTQPFMIGFSFDAGAFTLAYNENMANVSGAQSSMAASPSNLAMGMTAATLHGCLLTKQAVPARVFDTFYYEPYKLLMPVARPLYFDLGATAGIDALTALDLVVGSPVLGSPAIGQVHALSAAGLTVSSPVLGAPAIGQVHALSAAGLTVSSPVLGAPVLTENASGVDALVATNLVVGSPVLGTPTLGQTHVLGSDGLVTGPPVLGSPAITQIHALTALGLTVGAPVLGTPALGDYSFRPVFGSTLSFTAVRGSHVGIIVTRAGNQTFDAVRRR